MKIGFDLDGVLADPTPFKVKKARELYGIKLERWQVSSNVIDHFFPDQGWRRHIESLAGTNVHPLFVESATLDYLNHLASEHELYIISSRGKSKEGKAAAQQTIKELELAKYFGERIRFCSSDSEKISAVEELGCNLFVDDRINVVKRLHEIIQIALLYDNFQLWHTDLVDFESPPYLQIPTLHEVRKYADRGGALK